MNPKGKDMAFVHHELTRKYNRHIADQFVLNVSGGH